MLKQDALEKLQDALNTDGDDQVWNTSELEFILDAALSQVNQVRPRSVRDVIALEAGVDLYTLENVTTVTRVDLIDENGHKVATIPAQSWEVWGINDDDTLQAGDGMQQISVSLRWVREGYYLRVHGYGPWLWEISWSHHWEPSTGDLDQQHNHILVVGEGQSVIVVDDDGEGEGEGESPAPEFNNGESFAPFVTGQIEVAPGGNVSINFDLRGLWD